MSERSGGPDIVPSRGETESIASMLGASEDGTAWPPDSDVLGQMEWVVNYGGLPERRTVERWLVALRARTEAEPVGLRPQVLAFARLMENALRKHDRTRGEMGWDGDEPGALLRRLREEVDELSDALASFERIDEKVRYFPPNPGVVGKETADVGNFAMMIADVVGALAVVPTPPEDAGPETTEGGA